MAKFVALKETVLNGKLIAVGETVVGDKLDKKYPGLYRVATASESLSGDPETVNSKTIDKVVGELKKQVLEELKPVILEAVKAEVAAAGKPAEATATTASNK